MQNQLRGKGIAARAAALYLTFAILLVSSLASATVIEPRDLDDLIKESEFVGSVWIEQATSIADGPAKTYPACGASYLARTVDTIKGTRGTVNFHSVEELVVGREYLVLLSHRFQTTTDVLSTSSLSGAAPKTKRQWLADCASRHPGLWAIDGSEMPMLDPRLKIVMPGHAGDRWVARPFFLVLFDKIPTFDTDTIGAPWSMGPTPYPSGTYLSWRSVREVLAAAAIRTTPGVPLQRTPAK